MIEQKEKIAEALIKISSGNKSLKVKIDIYSLISVLEESLDLEFQSISPNEVKAFVYEIQKMGYISKQINSKLAKDLYSIPMNWIINKEALSRKSTNEHNGLDILRKMNGKIDISYYLKNYEDYQSDLEYILQINQFLSSKKQQLSLGINERAFELFGDEKALSKVQDSRVNGKKILANLGLSLKCLNIRESITPFIFPVGDLTKEGPKKS